AGGEPFTLSLTDAADTASAPTSAIRATLPVGLDVLRFALSDETHWSREIDGQCWSLHRRSGKSAERATPARQTALEGAGV
ncbi:hypothetical protein ACQV5M_22625, partial [Leptospira sp. SA-E8]|uniref:hypothetical protein n=1 Tax=Leptospira sp. SA-E8 TaxID=3422259 RepID=UPI003EBBBA12